MASQIDFVDGVNSLTPAGTHHLEVCEPSVRYWIALMASMSEERLLLQSDKGCRIVSPDEFVGMMISHHSLIRADEPAANLIGLRDESTGIRVLVAEEELLQVQSRKPHWN